jgi:hypothetical protein
MELRKSLLTLAITGSFVALTGCTGDGDDGAPGSPGTSQTLIEMNVLGSYASGPFAVVVGRSGNLAANERNRQLGQAFLADWVAHAQGAPPWCFDDDYTAERFAGMHLICIGSPRSNRVLAALDRQDPLPLRWDVRGLHLDGSSFYDGAELAVALCRPRPDTPSRLLVVLDGAIGWTRGGVSAPLADWPDLAVGPQPGYHDLGPQPQAVWRLFDNAWE